MIFNIPSELRGAYKGEQKVHDAFKKMFAEKKYFAIHSVGLANHETKKKGECDFILITDMGILCLEVKGSYTVTYTKKVDRQDMPNAKHDLWDYGGDMVKKESPFDQAEGAVEAVHKILGSRDKRRRNKFIIGRGVIFTELEFNDTSLEWDLKEVCSAQRFRYDFEGFIKELYQFHEERVRDTLRKGRNVTLQNIKPNLDDLKWAVQCIRPDIAHFSLMSLEASKDEIIRLEDKQTVLIDSLIKKDTNQCVIDGGPGSGKTVIIMEAISRLKRDEDILLVCFNKQLADYLQFRLSSFAKVTVRHFHNLMEIYCKAADISIPETKDENYFSDGLPNLFEEAIIKLITNDNLPQYDWLFIDEAQDFLDEKSFYNLMELIRGDNDKKNFVISADSNVQSEIYRKLDHEFLEKLKQREKILHLPLFANYRNPRILSSRAAIIASIEKPENARIFSSSPKLYHLDNQDPQSLKLKLNEILGALLKKGVKPEEITILTMKKRTRSVLLKMNFVAGCNLFDMKLGQIWASKSKNIGWSTAASFKGLENHYIILIEAESDNLTDWQRSMLFVTITRTKTEFIFIGNKDGLTYRAISNR